MKKETRQTYPPLAGGAFARAQADMQRGRRWPGVDEARAFFCTILLAFLALLFTETTCAQFIKLPTKSTIDVGLRLPQPKVSKVEDLLVSLSVTNKSGAPVKMLFDIPYRRDFGPWATRCIIRNSRGDTVHRYQNKHIIERKEWTPAEMESYRFVLRAQDYRLRLYALTDLAVLDDRKFDPKTGRLPPGRYTVQVFFYDIPSDIVSFDLRDPPETPKGKSGMSSSSPK